MKIFSVLVVVILGCLVSINADSREEENLLAELTELLPREETSQKDTFFKLVKSQPNNDEIEEIKQIDKEEGSYIEMTPERSLRIPRAARRSSSSSRSSSRPSSRSSSSSRSRMSSTRRTKTPTSTLRRKTSGSSGISRTSGTFGIHTLPSGGVSIRTKPIHGQTGTRGSILSRRHGHRLTTRRPIKSISSTTTTTKPRYRYYMDKDGLLHPGTVSPFAKVTKDTGLKGSKSKSKIGKHKHSNIRPAVVITRNNKNKKSKNGAPNGTTTSGFFNALIGVAAMITTTYVVTVR